MEPLYYVPKELEPGVLLDTYSNKFIIYGISCPNEPFEFFIPIIHWFNNYMKRPLNTTVFEIYFDYFDTITSKFLLKILYKLESIAEQGYDVKIQWFYREGDEDMYEEAEEFDYVIEPDFEIIPILNEKKEYLSNLFKIYPEICHKNINEEVLN